MHSCGNPLHDIPQWMMAAAPFLVPLAVWGRQVLSKLRSILSL